MGDKVVEYIIRYKEISKEELDLFLSSFEDTLFLGLCQNTYDILDNITNMSKHKNIIINNYIPLNECITICVKE